MIFTKKDRKTFGQDSVKVNLGARLLLYTEEVKRFVYPGTSASEIV